jgi:hypothetical protein
MIDDNDGQSRQSYRKQPAQKQTGLIDYFCKAFSCYFLQILLI